MADCPPISSSTGWTPIRETESFFDTNILLYLLSGENDKADRAEAVLAQGGTISVQVLNEFAAVAARKLGFSYPEIREVLEPIRAVCAVVPLTLETHDRGVLVPVAFLVATPSRHFARETAALLGVLSVRA